MVELRGCLRGMMNEELLEQELEADVARAIESMDYGTQQSLRFCFPGNMAIPEDSISSWSVGGGF